MSGWKDRLRALDELAPDDVVYQRAQEGPRHEPPDIGPSRAKRLTAGVVAFALFAAAGAFVWQAFRPSEGRTVAGQDDRSWPDLVLLVSEGDGSVDAQLSFGNMIQGLPIGFEGEKTSVGSPWFWTAVPVGTQLKIETQGDVSVSVETGAQLMDFGGSGQPYPDDELPQIQGTFAMFFLIEAAGRQGGAGSVIQLLDMESASASIMTLLGDRVDGSDPSALWAFEGELAMGASEQAPVSDLAREISVPAGSIIWLAGDADRLRLRMPAADWLWTEPADEDRQRAAVLPSEPGTYDLEVSGIWGQQTVDFSFQVELRPLPVEPVDPTVTPDETDSTPVGSPSAGESGEEASDVLRVVCDTDSIEVLTPVVAAQADGVHVEAEITKLHDPEVMLRALEIPQTRFMSGSEGTDEGFSRELPVGEAIVRCESGPGQGDGPEELEARFRVVDPDHVFIGYRPDCSDVGELGYAGSVERGDASSPEDAVRKRVRGLIDSDLVERAGYLGSDTPWLVVRVIRDGRVIAWFHVDGREGWRYGLMSGFACPDSGLSVEDAQA